MSDNDEFRNGRRGRPRYRGGRFSGGNNKPGSEEQKRDEHRSGRRLESNGSMPPAHRPVTPTPPCARCGQPIQDISSALADKGTGAPVHFDCVLEFLKGAEHLSENEKITYIGQGRFAVVVFENPADLRHFKIIRVIEWEEKDKKHEWRADIAGMYSQVK